MAIGWLTALKVIPWGDVLEAAPHIVKGAKRLFAKTKDEAFGPPIAPRSNSSSSDSNKLLSLDDRFDQIEAKDVELSTEQKSSAELIKSLAEQNARVVEAIEVFRIRTRVLMVVCIVLGAGLVVLTFLVATK